MKTHLWSAVLAFALLSFAAPATPVRAQASASDMGVIAENMAKLSPLIGTWDVKAEFHRRNGETVIQGGSYVVRPVLKGTYLQCDVTLWPVGQPDRGHQFYIFITYDPVTAGYLSTYIYSGWSVRVTEHGVFDDATKQFRTSAYIPDEDGKRDEAVRTLTDLSRPKQIRYEHYSRYEDETGEAHDLTITLSPAS
jgi:hypothetical protein